MLLSVYMNVENVFVLLFFSLFPVLEHCTESVAAVTSVERFHIQTYCQQDKR